MSETLRILVHAPRPELVAGLIAERHPQALITPCDSFADLPKAAMVDPHIAYTERFERIPYPREALLAQPSLRFIHASGAGINHLTPWDPEKVHVCNAGGVQDEGMAQFAIARLIAISCHFFRYHDQQKERLWKGHNVMHSTGGTLTVVGLGKIGRACARVGHALGMTVYGVRARPQPCEGVEEVVAPDQMHEVLAKSDYVIIVTPLTDQTRDLIDAAAIAAMKPGIILHDMSRGNVLEHKPLIEALNSGHVRAASLDVFEEEPLPQENPLWDMENVHVTPHMAGMITEDDYDRLSTEVFLDNLDRFACGEPLVNITDPVLGY
ncbi:MAG: D-2-hydroxyacid dehydrogenase [Alphaproteobacteria bacterium]|jgi:phosphoglycerate dehydrogenase-like enzyme|nr:D-2-hydroxyacid dehydrogenase [Rhodospirillaceae bacterium]MBT7613051.1 D-2-hydroxyacid dehydrogenase [Rhodospirillaceae bacterium]MBT7646635.1 D-2-hydroxyacid dehydrogenase [Rhodospirillaceae bacterium]MDG2479246.1 D-2-hydroxyacid dehydrogenase [Alphaproteobacteria bacterium]